MSFFPSAIAFLSIGYPFPTAFGVLAEEHALHGRPEGDASLALEAPESFPAVECFELSIGLAIELEIEAASEARAA
jgi:hypothetical protein